MAFVATLGALALNAGAVGLLGWLTWTAFQSREQPSAEPFVALLATLTLWAALAFGANLPWLSHGSLLATILGLGQFGTALVIPGIWTVYALSYTGRGTGLTWRRIALLAGIALPVLVIAVVIAVGPAESVVEYVAASMLGTEILYLSALSLYGTYLLADLGGSHARVSNTQIAVLTVGVAAPYLVGLLGNNSGLANGAAVGLVLSGGLLALAMRRYPVMTGFPKADYVARSRVVETLQEPVVVLDWDDHILDLNEATVALFDRSAAELIGEPVRSVIDGLDRTEFPVDATGTVTLQTTKGRRQFQFSVSAVDEGGSDEVARTVLFRDVTDRQTREQRLTVLNRVLRHNVRNDLDVVLSYADHIDDDDVRTGIRERATDLLELSSKARDAEDVMTASTDPPEPVDIADVAASVVEQFRTDDYSGNITLDCPDEVRISSHRTVIRRVLSELVENALVHSDADTPQVDVRVRDGPDAAAELVVADDGPGLPQREQEILAAGTETQLKHGRGLGLWFVNWAVTQLGGDLQFRGNDPGSVVTVRLYGTSP
ncbi:ATP-binding protein [Haloplanus halophilus]|uniref:ATP-binding protein n=1 Tax=Haloplanus halophilus TaxID=2949993 RepID=UPI002040F61D|nr:ATP-binding protein [Haloplanus sp. GDY1]